jgi:hypothetical protein
MHNPSLALITPSPRPEIGSNGAGISRAGTGGIPMRERITRNYFYFRPIGDYLG